MTSDIATGIINFSGGIFGLILMFSLLPLFIQVTLRMLVNTINGFIKTDISPIVDLILLPGSMLRLVFMSVIFYTMGAEFSWKYYGPYMGKPASNIANNYNFRGFTPEQKLPYRYRDKNPIKLSLVILVASYAVIPLIWIWVAFYDDILHGLDALFITPGTENIVYWVVLLTTMFGGLPQPNETMGFIYGNMLTHPQLVIALVLAGLGAILIMPTVGRQLTYLIFIFVMLINVGIVVANRLEKEDIFDVEPSPFDDLLQQEAV